MLRKVISIPQKARNFVWSHSGREIKAILECLCDSLIVDFRQSIKLLPAFNDSYQNVEAFHNAVEHLTDVYGSIKRFTASNKTASAEDSITLLDDRISRCKMLLRSGSLSNSSQANEIVNRVLNLLFSAKQRIKQRALIVSANSSEKIELPIKNTRPALIPASTPAEETAVPYLRIHSSLLYQLHHSLFPAERMILAAGMQHGNEISISALFDVTGAASAGGVHAEPERIAKALISMSETNTYLVAWLHSHPGTGPYSTYPSIIDRDQEADWLKDYSSLLVSAIMVRDGFIRFWGQALTNKRVDLRIDGPGIRRCSDDKNIYQLLS